MTEVFRAKREDQEHAANVWKFAEFAGKNTLEFDIVGLDQLNDKEDE